MLYISWAELGSCTKKPVIANFASSISRCHLLLPPTLEKSQFPEYQYSRKWELKRDPVPFNTFILN